MEIFDGCTINELIGDSVLLNSNGSCSGGHIVFTFKTKAILNCGCSGQLQGDFEALARNALLRIIHKNKSSRLQVMTKDLTFVVYRSNELLIIKDETELFTYHKSVYEYAFEYNKQKEETKIAGLFKNLVQELDDPPYEAWLMSKILKNRNIAG